MKKSILRLGRGSRSLLFLLLGLLGGLVLLGSLLGGSGALALIALRRRPERQVVAEELHDESRVFVALFRQCVELGNSVVERLLRQVACTVGAVEDLVVEDGEVEGKSEADGVGGSQAGGGNLGGGLVSLEGLVGRLLAAVTDSELREVSVVIALPGRTLAKCALPYLV